MSNSPVSHPRRAALSLPNLMLRLEGLAVLGAAVAIYAQQGFGWLLFALLFLVPDLAIVVYALNRRTGTLVYNLLHTTVLPVALGGVSLWVNSNLGLQIALIWLAHIGMDRMVGYGLKYFDSFKDTHLSRV